MAHLNMSKEQIQKYLAEHPEKRHRKYIPQIIEDLTGVAPEQQIQVKVALRRLQEAIPNDLFGKKKEEAWRDERGMKSQGEFVRQGNYITVNGQLMRIM